MVDISAFTVHFLQALNETFGERVWFVGLQGSYARDEATEGSDIDPVVILDELSAADIRSYDAMLDTLPHRDLICGFLSGKAELFAWEASDLFQFYHDTRPLKGTLDALLPLMDGAALDRAIKLGACNIYHGCVHNMLHEKSEDVLHGLYKSASFVIQAIALRQMGRYIPKQRDLFSAVAPEEQEILAIREAIKMGKAPDFEEASDALFRWSQKQIQ